MELPCAELDAAIDRMLAEDLAVLDGWIALDVLEGLLAQVEALERSGDLAPAGIGRGEANAVQSEIRSDLTRWWPEAPELPVEQVYQAHIRALADQINRACFAGIRSEELLYASYPPGAFYKRHLDRFRSDSARKISVITYLNRGWNSAEDGGELVAYTGNGEVRIAPEFGRTVFFRSDLLEHEVLPARRTRRSITGWLR